MLKTIFAITLFALSMSGEAALAQAPAAAPAVQQQNTATMQDDFRSVLTQYGRFVQHAKYGEVWIPTVTPQGWHPYPPCNWVNSRKYGWYYDDKTQWGEIVHHYGRWVSDPQMGWIWTPGAEFSPGWVVWRTSPEWIGWAPMLPDEDVQNVAASDANNAASWIFVETKKFAQGCNAAMQAPPMQIPMLLTRTNYVTDIRLVYGITVFVLPSYIVGPWIDIDIFFSPWPNWFLAQTLIDWNFMWNHLAAPSAVADQNCPPKLPPAPKPLPINNPQPPVQPQPPHQIPDRPIIDNNPPIVIVTPPICPPGTVMNDGACRLLDHCRPGTIRLGNTCVPEIRPVPPVVNNDPCAKLSGIELRRCLHDNPPKGGGDNKPPSNGGQTGPAAGGASGIPDPHKPNVTLPVDVVRPVQPTNRLPTVTSPPLRPNPVVLSPGGGGINKATGGASQQANNTVAPHHTLPVELPKRAGAK